MQRTWHERGGWTVAAVLADGAVGPHRTLSIQEKQLHAASEPGRQIRAWSGGVGLGDQGLLDARAVSSQKRHRQPLHPPLISV